MVFLYCVKYFIQINLSLSEASCFLMLYIFLLGIYIDFPSAVSENFKSFESFCLSDTVSVVLFVTFTN